MGDDNPSPVILVFPGVVLKIRRKCMGDFNPPPEVGTQIMREGWSRMVKITPIFARGPPIILIRKHRDTHHPTPHAFKSEGEVPQTQPPYF